jgi:hypothetical protein
MEAGTIPTSEVWHGRVAARAMMKLKDPALIATYAILSAYAGPDGTARITAGTVGLNCGRDRTWATRQLNRLAEIGLIGKIRRGACTTYCLLDQVCRTPRREKITPATAAPAVETNVTQRELHQPELCEPRTCEPAHFNCEPAHFNCELAHTKQTQIHTESGRLTQRARESGYAFGLGERNQAKWTPPAEWMPSESVLTEAQNAFPAADLNWHVARFIRRCHAGGYRFSDPNQAWLDWFLTDEPKRAARENRSGQNRQAPGEHRLVAWHHAVDMFSDTTRFATKKVGQP